MPESILSPSESNGNEILILQTKLIDLKKKLSIEKQMYEAAKLIKVRMDKERNVQQVENSLKEYLERIGFIEQQIRETEEDVIKFKDRKHDDKSEYLDAMDSLKLSKWPSIIHPSGDIKILLSGQKLSWTKIDFKIIELSCKLKVNENILEAEEKIIEAYAYKEDEEKGSNISNFSNFSSFRNREDIKELIEISRQRVQIIQQSLKKYTSLIIFNVPSTLTYSASNQEDHHHPTSIFSTNSNALQFTGKLMVKVTKLGGFTSGPVSGPPFTLNFSLNQNQNTPSNINTSIHKSSTSIVSINSASKDPENSTVFTCYQENVMSLVKASELELTISSGSMLKGIFFAKLGTIFPNGPDEEASLSGSFEIEPSGLIDLQFRYTPDKLKRNQLNKERLTRIERRPAIKLTQHFVKGHELISTNFFQLLKCSYCQEMIMNTSGYQCKLCKMICHRKCYSKLFEHCLYSETSEIEEEEEAVRNEIIDQFTSKYNIPHRQKLTSVAIPCWCAHCGHILPLGRKINYKCEECSIMWHDRCDVHICKRHCGLNSNIIETYLKTMENVKKDQRNKWKEAAREEGTEAEEAQEESSVIESKKLSINDFELIKCIGKGNFGKVMLGRYKNGSICGNNEEYYAIKMLKKHSIVENEEYESLKTEKKIFEIGTSAQNPFLVHLVTIFQDDFRIYFVMEFVNGGDLMYHIQNRPFTLKDCKFYSAQILVALEFLHSQGILYRDLKLDNVLLTREGNIKLADYGLSKCDMDGERRTRTFCGTPEFMSPELLLNLPYGFSVDYWAFGVLLYQMLESKSPFYGSNEKETFNSILKGKLNFSPEIDKHGKSLITKLLTPKPSDRLGIKSSEGWLAIKSHPFYSDINWDSLKNLQIPVPFKPKYKDLEDVSNFDEMFTNEDVLLTPYPSFVFSKGGNSVAEASMIFADF